VLTLIRHARRRLLKNELLAQGANAFSAALIAFILLLLFGTELLNWQLAAAIPAAALAWGVYRARKRTPPAYTVAQLVDRRLGFADTLSTAYFFSEANAPSPFAEEMRRCQFERAEEMAQSADVRRAVPFTMPRSVYLMAALVLVASSLFALRYGISRSIDLRPPLAQMLQDQFGWSPKTQVAKDVRRKPPKTPDGQQDDPGAATDEQEKQGAAQPDAAQTNQSEMAGQQEADKNGSNPKGENKQQAEGPKGGEEGDAQAEEKSDSSSDPQDSQQGNNGKQDQAQSGSKQDANNGENSSFLNKVKDAVQNLLSKVKPQQGNQGSQQQAGADQGQKQQGNGKQNGGKQQQSAKNGQQQGDQQGDAQEGQAGDESKNSQDQQGKGAGKSDTHQASKQPGSGIGSQDGDKSIKQAEQLAAMGKISEILGKRSANISGESTVEVQSTSQQLKTQYVQRGAQHTQAGAEINRDEVPVALQGFVEQYFEQVRKQAPSPATAAPVKKQ
jgi:hypothetical protein